MTDSEELIFITVMRVKIMVLDSKNSKEKRRDKKKQRNIPVEGQTYILNLLKDRLQIYHQSLSG